MMASLDAVKHLKAIQYPLKKELSENLEGNFLNPISDIYQTL